MTTSDINKLAQIIWDYMAINDTPVHSNIIVAFGSTDIRTAQRAAELYLEGYAPKIVMSGGHGRFTQANEQSEAERYRDAAVQLGVPKDDILIENKSSNSGENIQFTYELLRDNHIAPEVITLVQKPYMQRRAYATFIKQWPGKDVIVRVTSPQLSFEEYQDDYYTRDYVTNVIVGDLQRIKEYPKLGFQIEQDIPEDVWSAYKQLVELGYDKYLIR